MHDDRPGVVLGAPDAFKGSLSAGAVADAVADAARQAGWDCDRCPLSDGGEGFGAVVGGPAGLGFAIGKRRRMGWDFLGGDVIRRIHDEGPEWRLVGLTAEGRAPVRAGAVILDESGKETGHVTSGTFSPTLGRPIALARLRADCAADGTRVFTDLRGTRVALTVTPLPFVPHRYVR